jgi:preprotein translocase subunit YajC
MLSVVLATIIIAQEGAAPPAGQGPGQAQPQPPNIMMMILTMGVPIMLLYYFMVARPTQRRERDRKSMLAALKKNDHVVTIGGIKGVVAHVKPEEDEVVLKVDEASGAKLHVLLSSIARVVVAEEEAAPAKKES